MTEFIQEEYFKPILKPIEGDNPIGTDESSSSDYFALEEAYKCETDIDNRGVWVRKFKTTDWDSVERIAFEILSSKSKDMYVLMLLLDFIYVRKGFDAFLKSLDSLMNFTEVFPDYFPIKTEKRENLFDWFFKIINGRIRIIKPAENSDSEVFEYAYKNAELLKRFKGFLINKKILTARGERFFEMIGEFQSKYVVHDDSHIQFTPELVVEVPSVSGENSNDEIPEDENVRLERGGDTYLSQKFSVEDAYRQIEAIKNFLETHEPRKVTYLLLDLVKELKGYTIKDLIQYANDETSPMSLLSKLICKGDEKTKKTV